MALDTYTNLKASVADWLARSDLTAVIPDFITLAESKIARDVRRKTVINTAFSITADAQALGTVGEMRSLWIETTPGRSGFNIAIVSPETLAEKRTMYPTASRPKFACVIEQTLYMAPVPDQTYTGTMIAFEKLVPLSGSVATNSVLTEAPDVYLYGTLCEAAPYLEHDARIEVWRSLFVKACEDLNRQREREEYGASVNPIRLPVVFG